MSKLKKAVTQLAEVTSMLAGLASSPPPSVNSVPVEGNSLTIPQLVAELQGIQQLNQAAADSKAKWKASLAATKAQSKSNRTLLTAIRRALILAYGSDTAGLAACGIVVTPRVPRSSKTNAIAQARAAATRKANGTGKKAPAPAPTLTVTETNGQVIGGNPAPVAPAAGNAAPAVAAVPATAAAT
jgi:hypothetical protein